MCIKNIQKSLQGNPSTMLQSQYPKHYTGVSIPKAFDPQRYEIITRVTNEIFQIYDYFGLKYMTKIRINATRDETLTVEFQNFNW